jgi:hypothetical protein
MTEDEVRALPPLVPPAVASRALGFSEGTGRRLLAAGRFPVPVVQLSPRIRRVRRRDLLAAIGIDAPGDPGPEVTR